ncbi:uncharacterized protein LOC144434686 [Glandiceps talaboti]
MIPADHDIDVGVEVEVETLHTVQPRVTRGQHRQTNLGLECVAEHQVTEPVNHHDYICTHTSTLCKNDELDNRPAKVRIISISGNDDRNAGKCGPSDNNNNNNNRNSTVTSTGTQTDITCAEIDKYIKENESMTSTLSNKSKLLRDLFIEKVVESDSSVSSM